MNSTSPIIDRAGENAEKTSTDESVVTTAKTDIIEKQTVEIQNESVPIAKITEQPKVEIQNESSPIAKITEQPKVAYTNEEKFAQMSRKNPALKTFKQQLSLDFL